MIHEDYLFRASFVLIIVAIISQIYKTIML